MARVASDEPPGGAAEASAALRTGGTGGASERSEARRWHGAREAAPREPSSPAGGGREGAVAVAASGERGAPGPRARVWAARRRARTNEWAPICGRRGAPGKQSRGKTGAQCETARLPDDDSRSAPGSSGSSLGASLVRSRVSRSHINDGGTRHSPFGSRAAPRVPAPTRSRPARDSRPGYRPTPRAVSARTARARRALGSRRPGASSLGDPSIRFWPRRPGTRRS